MGSHEFDTLPASPSWKRVVGLLGSGAGMAGLAGVEPGSIDDVAAATLEASAAGLERAKGDDGLGYVFYLLTQITQAARGADFAAALGRAGIRAPAMAVGPHAGTPGTGPVSVHELVANLTDAVDRHLRRARTRTDIGEMAQRAAAGSVVALCSEHAKTLFGVKPETVQSSLRTLSTKSGFARLTREFFARLTGEYLTYHLSRELANHVGPNRRFTNVANHNQFLRELHDHCRARSTLLHDFAGTWYSKHNFQGGITREKAQGFVAHAIDKVRDAMRREGAGDGN